MLDHLIYLAPDLDHAAAALKARLGVRPAAGGVHPGLGTRNALLALGPDTYLEILAPDPDQAGTPMVFDFAALAEPYLATWVARAPDIDDRVLRAREAGFDPGIIMPMERRKPSGAMLEWRLTWREEPACEGLVPMLIDWCETPTPARDAPTGCRLLAFHGEHPEPDTVRPALEALDVDLDLRRGEKAALVALVEGPNGRFILR
jgi:hypothetical protein